MGFNSVPVVNMAGRLIGIIPTSFVVTLIEQHCWYDEEKVYKDKDNGEDVSKYYRTAMTRQASAMMSPRSSIEDISTEFGLKN